MSQTLNADVPARARLDRQKFYAALRKRKSGLFGTSLTQVQVDGLESILDEAVQRSTARKHLAYIFATAYHETGGRMQPVAENLNYSVTGLLKTFARHRISKADAQKYGRSGGRKADQEMIANTIYGGKWGRDNLGNTLAGDGWTFRGRGLVQITGRANYRTFGLETNPDTALDLAVSVFVLFEGMVQGLFTGKRLGDFPDYRSMRRVVNGVDRADDIAGYAQSFEAALIAAGYGALPAGQSSAGAPDRAGEGAPEAAPAKPASNRAPGLLAAFFAFLASLIPNRKEN